MNYDLKHQTLSKTKAFSLIEIMVVVTLISILAAIAIPSYNKYTIKTKLSKAMPVIKELSSQIITKYEILGRFANIRYHNTPISTGSWISLKAGPVKNLYWDVTRSDNDTPRSFMSLAISGLDGIPGYEEPENTFKPGSIIRIYTYLKNGTFKTVCGKWSLNDTNDIPLEYLPTGCRCTNLKAHFDAGTEDDTCD